MTTLQSIRDRINAPRPVRGGPHTLLTPQARMTGNASTLAAFAALSGGWQSDDENPAYNIPA